MLSGLDLTVWIAATGSTIGVDRASFANGGVEVDSTAVGRAIFVAGGSASG